MRRTLVVWCPDWPLTAAGVVPASPAIVVTAGRVAMCTAAARAAGVRIGLRRREAQARCPELVVLDVDPGRDARVFDEVVTAATALVPAVEVVRPGLLALDPRGPSRVLGGEAAVADRLRAVMDDALRSALHRHTPPEVATQAPGCRVGVADGRFAALLAARQAPAAEPVLRVPPGGDAAFLAPQAVGTLTHTATDPDHDAQLRELAELLRRLGIWTLGALATLPHAAVAERFGPLGAHAHRLAGGDDGRPVVPIHLLPDLSVRLELDPPAERVEVAAFAARGLADTLITSLTRDVLACTLVAIEASTEHGETLIRRWRVHEGFTPALLADRVRWQLDGWLTGSAGEPRPTAGITLLRLIPEEVIAGGQQGSLLPSGAPDPQVTRALTRIQGMLGPDGVLAARPSGGRDPGSWVALAPWGEARSEAPGEARSEVRGEAQGEVGSEDGTGSPMRAGKHATAGAGPTRLPAGHPGASSYGHATAPVHGHAAERDPGRAAGPEPGGRPGRRRTRRTSLPPAPVWPGRLPAPAPATVLPDPVAAEVVDAQGAPVTVSGRAEVSAAPARLRIGAQPWREVVGWAGPWPADERWWDAHGRRRARFQLATTDGAAYLASLERGTWQVEAIYD